MTKVGDNKIVYNRRYSGLNMSLWEPQLKIPYMRSTIWGVEMGTCMVNWDIGCILLNFMNSEEVRPFFAVGVANNRI